MSRIVSTINIKGEILTFDIPRIMGILNITPDSFFDGGNYITAEAASDRAGEMLSQGADIIDVGGASSRPGAVALTAEEEMERVLPVIEKLTVDHPGIRISVDTYHAKVAEEAAKAGAGIINDISFGDDDPLMFDVIEKTGLPYIGMHKQGDPKTMQDAPEYRDVVTEVFEYMKDRVTDLRKRSVKDVIIDPGFGFGKTVQHNYKLLAGLGVFKQLGCPILVGVSRKSMINKVLKTKAADALNGTTAIHMAALMKGGDLLRVHDVEEAVQVVKLYKELRLAEGNNPG